MQDEINDGIFTLENSHWVRVICSCVDSVKTRCEGRNNDDRESNWSLLCSPKTESSRTICSLSFFFLMCRASMLLLYAASFEMENMLTVFMWPVKKGCCNTTALIVVIVALLWQLTSGRHSTGGKKNPHGGKDLSFCGSFKDFLSRLILIVELISLTIVPSRYVP